jgi:LacI family transcriptional regulator
MLCNSAGDIEIEAEYLDLLPQKGIDGLILVPMLRTKKALYEHLPADMPVVILDRPIPGIPQSVCSDEEQLCTLLCDALRRASVKTVTMVCGWQYILTHRERYEIISAQFEVLGMHEGRAQKETGRQAFSKFVGLKPDAVVCTNNFLGQGYIDAMPSVENAPIIGCFDDIPMMQHLPLPIVCANQDVELLAEGCVSQLLQLLQGDAVTKPEPVLLPSRAVTNLAFQKRFDSSNTI